jgi:uncharacterized membrane protein
MEKQLPKEIKHQRTEFAVSEQYSGPLPKPSDLERYESIFPGLAERIVIMAEKEAETRHQTNKIQLEHEKILIDMEKANSESIANISRTGTKLSFAVAIVFCILLFYSLYIGNNTAIISLSGIMVAVILAFFNYDRFVKK